MLKEISKSENPGLILEDDVISLFDNPRERVKTCIEQAPPGWDVLFVSDAKAGSDLRGLTTGVYGREWVAVRESRNTLAWVVSPAGAKKLLDKLSDGNALGLYPTVALDNWFSTLLRQDLQFMNVWWSLSPFLTNGNKCEKFKKTY